jgi:hypothetical protein
MRRDLSKWILWYTGVVYEFCLPSFHKIRKVDSVVRLLVCCLRWCSFTLLHKVLHYWRWSLFAIKLILLQIGIRYYFLRSSCVQFPLVFAKAITKSALLLILISILMCRFTSDFTYWHFIINEQSFPSHKAIGCIGSCASILRNLFSLLFLKLLLFGTFMRSSLHMIAEA